ncbi:hypothetical protein [Streptomyces sp. ALI-76-A]|jgi:hypothetical protein|uniref:hypothetical protein n=1 Tax=Streptomyces sp. ALI-76-A TaxID=3025736 RepID=UPI00256F0161|nr:hypothetical protein [Streptomyces sp. ALI-76-A]MDL5205613.1 hypothetical protein [Streptomyces sp. ALI-76-A]
MGFDGEVWQVRGGDGPIGEIVVDDMDFPWLAGRFTAGPGFGAVAGPFARELDLIAADDEDHRTRWEAVHDEIRRRVTLSSPDGPVPGFLLRIGDGRA